MLTAPWMRRDAGSSPAGAASSHWAAWCPARAAVEACTTPSSRDAQGGASPQGPGNAHSGHSAAAAGARTTAAAECPPPRQLAASFVVAGAVAVNNVKEAAGVSGGGGASSGGTHSGGSKRRRAASASSSLCDTGTGSGTTQPIIKEDPEVRFTGEEGAVSVLPPSPGEVVSG